MIQEEQEIVITPTFDVCEEEPILRDKWETIHVQYREGEWETIPRFYSF